MSLPRNLPVGTRIRCIQAINEVEVGDLATIVASDDLQNAYLLDNPRGRSARWLTMGVEGHYTTSSGHSWEVVPATTGPVVGERIRVTEKDAYGADVEAGDEGVITHVNEPGHYDPDEFYVLMDTYRGSGSALHHGGHWVFRDEHVTFLGTAPATSTEPVTLQSYRLDFLKRAHARGVANGTVHQAQVEKALDRLAGLEYLDPSATLEAFQQRVVDLAMSAKGEHRWCGEPEAFLTEFGLEHLLPVRKTINVIVTVEVTGDANTTPGEWQERAAALVPHANGSYAPRRDYTINNDL